MHGYGNFQIAERSLSYAKIIKILGIKMILMIFNTDNIVCLYWFCNDMLMVVPVSTLTSKPQMILLSSMSFQCNYQVT